MLPLWLFKANKTIFLSEYMCMYVYVAYIYIYTWDLKLTSYYYRFLTESIMVMCQMH